MARRVELIAGVLAGALGVIGLLYAVFGPTGTASTCTFRSGALHCTTASQSLWQQGLDAGAVAAILVALALFVVIAVSAYLHAWRHETPALVVLWASALLLTAAGVIAILSIGIFILVPAVLALIAAIAGSFPIRGQAGRTMAAA